MIEGPYSKGTKSMPPPAGGELMTRRLYCAVTAAQLTSGAILAVGYLPVDCEFVDAVHFATDLDTGGTPAVVMSFGVINDAGTDLDVVMQAGIDVGKTGGAVRATLTAASLLIASGSATPKRLGYKVTTAPATAAAGTVYTDLSYRAVN